jgi:small subunit ribosomal protein S7
MSRRVQAPKRDILPDPKYGSVRLAKFINILMLDGKKAVAERVIYGALEVIKEKGITEPVEVLEQALGWWCNLPGTCRSSTCTKKRIGYALDY